MRRTVCVFVLLAALLLPASLQAGESPSSGDPTPADAATAYRHALELEAAGRAAEAKAALEQVLALDPEHRAARRALGYEQVAGRWLSGDDLKRAKGFIHHDGRWMTAREFAEATRPEREASEQKAGEARVLRLLGMIGSEDEERVRDARRRLALEDDGHKLAPLAKALRCEPPSLRLYAAEELGRMANPLAVPALLKRAIEDPDEAVRVAVVDALREIGEPSTVDPLGRALGSRYTDVRVRAAEALGRLGDEVGAGYLVKRWSARSGDFPRVYFASVRQISYIQDFDVEVAQTSFIADPIIGVLQEGVVQAVKVLATEVTFETVERIAYEEALSSLSGQEFGSDLRAWHHWWKENEEKLLEERLRRIERRAK